MEQSGTIPATKLTLGGYSMATMEEVRKKVAMERKRLALDLSDSVSAHLDEVSEVLGVPKSQLVVQCVIQGLPGLLARAEELRVKPAPKGAKR